MVSAARLLASTSLLLAVGCAGEYKQQTSPLLLDSMLGDWAFFTEPEAGGGELCAVPDAYCPGGKICYQGVCKAPACLTSGLCASGSCQPSCVPMFDDCKGVSCGKGETCVEGHCVRGCFPQPCNGVACGPGQYCSRSDGKCRPLVPCSASCPFGFECSLVACAPDLCKGVTCPEGQRCAEGKCLPNPCAKVTCEGGAICQNGKCIDSCTLFGPPVPPPPPPPKCTPSCKGKGCGASDGCGGICKECGPGQSCINSATGWLCCTPNCEGKTCGAADGCGGTCGKGSCPAGESCQNGKCVCVPDCTGKTCNDDNGCGGKCKGCPAPDQVCDTGQAVWVCCAPSCDGKACGEPDGCGGTCGKGSCPAGESCQNGKCVCVPDCTGKTCNDDNGCGGKCKGCPVAGQVCDTGQAVWVCCAPSCAGKACGASDGCGGICKTGSCPTGQSCQSGKCVSPPPPPPAPPPKCGCGQQLIGSTCVSLCGPDTTLCGCTSCCKSGYVCDWASSTCKPGVG